MKRIRTMAVAVAMALALTAVVGASSASANWFKMSVNPGKWTGSITGVNHLFAVGEVLSCSESSFTGETVGNSFKEVTVTPQFKCNFPGPVPATWEMNSCKFRFNAGRGPALSGTMDIVGCVKPMRVYAGLCEVEIGNQKGLGTVSYENVAKSFTITATANLKSITYTSKNCSSPNGTFQNGSYAGNWTIKGSTVPGAPAATEIESTPAAPFGFFGLEEAPATLAAASTGMTKRVTSIPGMETSCESFTMNGTAASITPVTLALRPTYKNCTVGGVAVGDNYIGGDCDFVLHADGKFDIATGGPWCSSGKFTITGNGCSVQFPPQTGLSGVTYTNQGSGKLRTITLGGTVTNLKYTAAGPFCSKYGEFSDGTIAISGKLTATNSGGGLQGISAE